MIVRAWISSDGLTVQQQEHLDDSTLSAWWTALPGIVGVMVIFPDSTRHRMEAREFYGLGSSGSSRQRFWVGDNPADAPGGYDLIAGVLVPDVTYEQASDDMEQSR